VIQAGGISNANKVNTLNMGELVGADLEGPASNEEWEIVGNLMYWAVNS